VKRIAIVGCGGSGKSHVGRVLADRLRITPVHLDALHYDKDWKSLDQETFASPQRDLVAAPGGSSMGTTPPPCQSAWGPPTR
jgi:adenylate kinase family enzyme